VATVNLYLPAPQKKKTLTQAPPPADRAWWQNDDGADGWDNVTLDKVGARSLKGCAIGAKIGPFPPLGCAIGAGAGALHVPGTISGAIKTAVKPSAVAPGVGDGDEQDMGDGFELSDEEEDLLLDWVEDLWDWLGGSDWELPSFGVGG